MNQEFDYFSCLKNMNLEKFNRQFALLLSHSGRTVKDIQEACGLSRRALFYYLNNRKPDPLTAALIVTSLGYPVQCLFEMAFANEDNVFVWGKSCNILFFKPVSQLSDPWQTVVEKESGTVSEDTEPEINSDTLQKIIEESRELEKLYRKISVNIRRETTL